MTSQTGGPTHDVFMAPLFRSHPAELTVTARVLPDPPPDQTSFTTPAIRVLGEVNIGGHPVHGTVTRVHHSMLGSESATQHVVDVAIAGFAAALAGILGYDREQD